MDEVTAVMAAGTAAEGSLRSAASGEEMESMKAHALEIHLKLIYM